MFEQIRFTNQIKKTRFLLRKNRFFKIHYRTKRDTYRLNQILSYQKLININQCQKLTNVFKIRQLQQKIH